MLSAQDASVEVAHHEPSRLKARLKTLIGPVIGVSLFLLALYVLHHGLGRYRYHDIMRSLHDIPSRNVIMALGFTVLNYFILTCYDALALRYIRRPLSAPRTILTSFVSYAFSQNLGFGWLTGGSLRYRLYTVWGLSAVEITTIVTFCAITFWLGILAVGGLVFAVQPVDVPSSLQSIVSSVRPIGIIFLAIVAAYILRSFVGKRTIKIRQWVFPVPTPTTAATQITVAAADWTVAGSVLYALLPNSHLSFVGLLGIFLLAQVIGLVSHVPGGLGIFEALILSSLTPDIPAATVMGSLVAYRVIYYLLPLACAIVSVGAFELWRSKWGPRGLSIFIERLLPTIAPRFLAVTTFLGGVILLVSGATPALHSRVEWLLDLVPLPVIEVSHFAGSLIGGALLFVAWGIYRRLDAAWHATVALLSGGIIASLLKGADYEEAFLLCVMLLAILPSHKHFYRKSTLLSQPLSATWIVAIIVAIGGSIGVGFFAYKHVGYSGDLWWHFAVRADAPRFLRASVGVMALASIVAAARLLRPATPAAPTPTPADLSKVERIVAASPLTSSYLALLGDKSFLFSASGNSFIMYGVEGRTWVAMGDPIGPESEWTELIWRFRELCDQYDGWPVFYQVAASTSYRYVDIGLSLLKLGEEARVHLPSFEFDALKKTMRHSYRKVDREGGRFKIVSLAEQPELLDDLKRISDAWLEDKHTREKGFSLGHFDLEYLRRGPIAVVCRDSHIVAFANILEGANKYELSIDLMRYVPDAPAGLMDYLFIALMLWGKEQGYAWFNLGMAPLSGLERRSLAPLWSRLGAFFYRAGEHFYNFQGLRSYKEKFNPVWEPRYLASPGGIVMPRILANVTALISGGMKGALTK